MLENLLGTGKVAGAGGIERGVNVVFMQAPEQFRDELGLQKRFAARDGDTSIFAEIGAVTEDCFAEILCCVGRAAG